LLIQLRNLLMLIRHQGWGSILALDES
jgi:hypothetical protein